MDRECVVWSASVDLLRPAHAALLRDDERARAEGLSRPADRARTLLAAALVRLAGARALDLDPLDADTVRRLDVDRRCPSCAEPHGKPSIGNGVHLSASHAGELVVVAVSRVSPVGIDVEPATRAADAQAAAQWACAAEERARIADPGDALRCWVRKEAIVKATGEGLTTPLADIRVSAPREPARFVRWSGRPDQPCTLIDLNPPAGYVASLAVLSNGPLRVIELSADHLLAA